MSRILILPAAACLAALLACSAQSDPAAPEGGAASPAFVNANCPMMGKPVDPKAGSVTFRGHAVGFCCEGCAPKFEKLGDEEKLAALAEHGTALPE